MFGKLLLPLDLTNRHDAALKTAAELATKSGGSVTLLHVIELIPGLSIEEEKAFYDRLRKQAQDHLDRLGAALMGVSWQNVVVLGNRLAETVKYAEKSAADLIIISAPRLDPARPLEGWASFSFKVGFASPVPVLLIK